MQMQFSYHNVSETVVEKRGCQLLTCYFSMQPTIKMWCAKSEGCGRSPAAICNSPHPPHGRISVREKACQPVASCALTQTEVGHPKGSGKEERWAVLMEDIGTADVCSAYRKPSTRRAGPLRVGYWRVTAAPAANLTEWAWVHTLRKRRGRGLFSRECRRHYIVHGVTWLL